MKFLLPIEEAVHHLRDSAFARLRDVDWFQRTILRILKDQVVLVTKQFDDHRLTFSPYEAIGNLLFRQGHYQRDLAERVLAILGKPPGRTLLEIGANIGTHTVYLTRSGQFKQVICIEPEPRNLLLLKQNLILNDLGDRTTVVECAVSDHEGVADFYFNDQNFGASTLIKPDGAGAPTSVQVRRVDGILRDLGLRADDIGLVWMDIEGAEPEAIKSMAELVEQRVPIVMEYAPLRYDSGKAREMTRYLSKHYGRCLLIEAGEECEVDLRELSLDGQFDILLLP
ncbi:FkbM family methyltransferase [Mesorhizobium sp.]|uniref:FkbM family methyltransferase n=1 Tax=Mesorhizobium sp. TaxID=1871066 RepID=UPI0025DA6FCD|nr:FkbM family methyltransferase [Mesorhizobium sp.]